jgi:hypothetical protein
MPVENDVAILKIVCPKCCKECQLHVLTLENHKEVFSCAGYKGHGTLNPTFDHLNTFALYTQGRAVNCPLEIKEEYSKPKPAQSTYGW